MRFYSNIFFTILCCWPSWFSCSQGFSSVIHQFSSHFCIRYFFLSSPKFRVLWRWKNRDDYPVPIPYRIPSDCDWFGSLSWDKSFASLFYVLCYFDPVIYFIHLQINRCDLTLFASTFLSRFVNVLWFIQILLRCGSIDFFFPQLLGSVRWFFSSFMTCDLNIRI